MSGIIPLIYTYLRYLENYLATHVMSVQRDCCDGYGGDKDVGSLQNANQFAEERSVA